LPFGDGYQASGTDDDPYHFATLDQDNTGAEHAQAREDSNTAGRWMSPDPYVGSYDATNPQSFDRYTYAANNPLSLIDPTGLITCPLPRTLNQTGDPCEKGSRLR
jgi:RHS repeat-associated protein